MASRMKDEEIARLTAEVTRLAQEREVEQLNTLERAEFTEILKQLNLPVDLTDEAMVQLARREAQARKRRNKTIKIVTAAALALVLIIAMALYTTSQNAALESVTGSQARITLAVDEGANLESVSRSGKEVFYRVNLEKAPIDQVLEMSCNWYDPNGNIFRQNRWQTRTIDKSVWPTFCKCQIGPSAEKGEWKVEMLLDGRVVSTSTFKVE